MTIGRPPRRKAWIPTNAMSDIGFLLLIFIMLVSLINYRREVKIDYPEAKAISRTQERHNLELWVDRAGAYYADGKPCDLAGIEAAIVDAYAKRPDTRVHVIADRDTPYEKVAAIVDILELLEHRTVSFVAKD
jgi:biopolymer transport protein ExbD